MTTRAEKGPGRLRASACVEEGGARAGVVGQVGQRRRLQYDTAGHIMPRAGDAPAREGVGSCLDGNASAT